MSISRVDDAVSYVSNPNPLETYTFTSSHGPGASSSADFGQGTVWDVYGRYLDRMDEVANANNAASAAQAAELRSWQERQNQKAMDFNAREAAKNRDWQQMMSNTAHQREVADLIAAGLNPVLSATGGNGAAVTSGATASGVTSSGAKGDVDMSRNQGIASLLGSMLSAQTSILNTVTNALNNKEINEHTNEVNKLIALMNNATSKDVASTYYDLGVLQSLMTTNASMSNARTSADAVMQAAMLSYLASKYGYDMQYKMRADFPDTWPSMLERLFAGLGWSPYAFGSNMSGFFGALQDWLNSVGSRNNGSSGSDRPKNFVYDLASAALPGSGVGSTLVDLAKYHYLKVHNDGSRNTDRYSRYFQNAVNRILYGFGVPRGH